MSKPNDDAATLAALAAPPEDLPLAPPLESAEPHAGVSLRSRVAAVLATSMFLHHFSMSAWVVTLGSYVMANTGGNGAGIFAAGFVGTAYAAGPIGGMLSPFLTGLLADNYFATEKIMAVLSLGCAVAMWAAVEAQTQWTFFAALVCYFLFYLPSFSLVASMSMHQLADPARQFPAVRACGTMGWIAGGVFVGWVWPLFTGQSIENTAVPMKIAIVGQLVTAAFCYFLPHTPPTNRRHRDAAPSASGADLRDLLRSPLFIGLMVVAVLAHIPSQFYYAYSNAFLNNWVQTPYAAAKLTLGQVVEVTCMLTLPFVLARARVKSLILLGLAIWTVRFAMLAASASPTIWGRDFLLYAAILLHGVAYTYLTLSLQLEVDRCAGRKRRATAQGLLTVAIQGLGCFVGAWLSGLAGAKLAPADAGAATAAGWQAFWALPAAGAAAVWVLAALVLPREDRPKR